MLGILNVHRSPRERADVIRVGDVSQELGVPLPQRIAVELTQKRGVMKADPSSLPQRNVALKGSDRLLLPAIGRVVELDEERIPAQESVVEGVGVLNIIHSETAVRGEVIEPSPGSLR